MKQTGEVSRSAPVRHRKSVVRRLEMLLAARLQMERRWKCCWRRSYRRSAAGNAVSGAVTGGAPLEMLLAASLQMERHWKCYWRRGFQNRRPLAGSLWTSAGRLRLLSAVLRLTAVNIPPTLRRLFAFSSFAAVIPPPTLR